MLGSAQNYRISTVAGFGTFGGDGGPATAALVNPAAVAASPDGTLYVADPYNYRIRKIDRSGTITTLIGTGSGAFSGDGGPAAAAQIAGSYSLALDTLGNLFFTDEGNLRIREVSAAGVVKTIAGNGTCGTTIAGMAATNAPLCDVDAVAVDTQGRVYFGSSSRVWMVGADGSLVLIAGDGVFGNKGDGGLATAAEIGYPGSIVIDSAGNLYLGDIYNSGIRKVTPDKQISTVIKISNTSATTIQLALDASATLFYANGTSQAYKVVQGASAVAATVTVPNRADCITADQSGALYLCSSNTQRLFKSVSGSSQVLRAPILTM